MCTDNIRYYSTGLQAEAGVHSYPEPQWGYRGGLLANGVRERVSCYSDAMWPA